MVVLHTLQEYIDALRGAGLLLESTVTEPQVTVDCFSYDNRAVSGTALFFCKGAHFKDAYLRAVQGRGGLRCRPRLRRGRAAADRQRHSSRAGRARAALL